MFESLFPSIASTSPAHHLGLYHSSSPDRYYFEQKAVLYQTWAVHVQVLVEDGLMSQT
jgi:hypothetical protein